MNPESLLKKGILIPEFAYMFPIVDGTLNLPEGITCVYAAYRGESSLRRLDLPEGLRVVGDSSFSCCVNLESVRMPSSLRGIQEHAFSSCQKLSSLEFPDSLEEIGECAFAHCEALESVKMPAGRLSIAENAFFACPNLRLSVVGGSDSQRYAETHSMRTIVRGVDD